MSALPLNYLTGSGARANSVLPLTWAVLIISIVVCVVIGTLLWMAVRRRPAKGALPADVAITREGDGLRLIGVGLVISLVPLLATLVWTMAALAAVGPVPRRPGLTIDVTGHQWWWQVDYEGAQPNDRFTTANEIHIPTGVPVLVRLRAADVIHSFWVPQLTGKTDLIPGQVNQSWMQADKPGRYWGQCTEYCGAQHAHMGFQVVAEPPAQFERWRTAQLQTAPPAATPAQARGLALVEYRCALCHSVRGTIAHSNAGPDLTHLMSRATIAAGLLPNNPGSLGGWIQDPQSAKPNALMPAQNLTGAQLTDLLAYLETLK